MNNNELKSFILKASRNTYASEDTSIRKKKEDTSTTITYQDGEYSYHDNYFGGEPYGGREVVFYNNKPIWMMVYYGWIVEGNSSEDIYKVLTKALRNSNIDMPYRGPKELIDGEYKYVNKLHGDVDNFYGEEKIFIKDTLIYTAKYMGGLICKE